MKGQRKRWNEFIIGMMMTCTVFGRSDRLDFDSI